MRRRSWILSALGATGALVVGWGILPARSRLGTPATMLPTEGDVALNGWIKIGKDGGVILAMPRSEMGQGVHTGLAMLVAEELDLPLSRVRLEQATADTMLRFGIADDGAVVDELATALTELKRLQGLQDEWRSRKSLEIPEMKCVQCRHL